jgi:hypothetical protein
VESLEERTVPSTFTVNELSDTHAVNLISGVDSTGRTSLRSAIEAANHLGGDETIQFDSSVFASARVITLRLGLLNLNDAGGTITIQGPPALVAVSGDDASEVFRVHAGTTADLSDLAIVAGMVTGWDTDDGGGIYNNGTLTITDSKIANNTALTPAPIQLFGGYGGGIYNNASLTLVDCTISGNSAGSLGAGIDNSVNGTVDLTDSTVARNHLVFDGFCVVGSGGGICNSGNASVTDSTISGNTAAMGGGIFNAGPLTVRDSIISGNGTVPSLYNQGGAWGAGGGIFNENTATVSDSRLIGNVANGYGANGVGGAIGSADAGMIVLDQCMLSNNAARSGGAVGCLPYYSSSSGYDPATVNDCTISGNSAISGGGVYIGASDDATLTNSTISGNTAAHGGGVYLNQAAKMTCVDSTISGNTAVAGGGIFVNESVNYVPSLNLANTIIAGNISHALDGDVVGAVAPSSVNNLIGDGVGIRGGISNNTNGNQIGIRAAPINPLLAPLGNYGGPTQTMALLPGSPAIDAGSNAAIPAGVTTDQRGEPRIYNGTVDIGAVELVPSDQIVTITSPDQATFVVGQSGSFTITTTGLPWAALTETGSLPAGVTFTDNRNGTATLKGIPKAGSASITPYTFTIQASNGVEAAAMQTFTLTIDQAPTITSAGSATFVIGRANSFTITTTGFPVSTLSEIGTLPAGVTWTDNGNGTATLGGTPLPGDVRTTPYSFTIEVSNGVGAIVKKTFKLLVR